MKDEKASRYREVERIIIEETQKVESMLYLFKEDMIKLKNRVEDFERRTKDLEAPKKEEMLGESLLEATKSVNRFFNHLNKFTKIKEEALSLKNTLEMLSSKYGKGAGITKEMIEKTKEVT